VDKLEEEKAALEKICPLDMTTSLEKIGEEL